MTTPTIPAADVEALLRTGKAQPLLADHFPVPVRLDGWWWHVPNQPPPEVPDGVFVPATPAACAGYERLLDRRLAADAALGRRSATS